MVLLSEWSSFRMSLLSSHTPRIEGQVNMGEHVRGQLLHEHIPLHFSLAHLAQPYPHLCIHSRARKVEGSAQRFYSSASLSSDKSSVLVSAPPCYLLLYDGSQEASNRESRTSQTSGGHSTTLR